MGRLMGVHPCAHSLPGVHSGRHVALLNIAELEMSLFFNLFPFVGRSNKKLLTEDDKRSDPVPSPLLFRNQWRTKWMTK